MNAEPHFLPFEGRNYQNQTVFPGRFLILGESHYLREKVDNTPDFTRRILDSVVKDHQMTGWKTRFFINLFYVLTGKQNHDVSQIEWEEVWNSIAFYNYLQTARLTQPLMQPTQAEWEDAKLPFQTILSRLQPEFIVIAGYQTSGNATSIKGMLKRDGVRGVWLPTGNGCYAFARCIYHPSTPRFEGAKAEMRSVVAEMFTKSWPAPTSARG